MESLDILYLFFGQHFQLFNVCSEIIIKSDDILKEVGINFREDILLRYLETLLTFGNDVLGSISLAHFHGSLQVLDLGDIAQFHQLIIFQGKAFDLVI